jgi:hypothetical protein
MFLVHPHIVGVGNATGRPVVLSYLERLPAQLLGCVEVDLFHTYLSKCGA